MDLRYIHSKTDSFVMRNPNSRRPFYSNLRISILACEIKLSSGKMSPSSCKYRPFSVKAMGRKNPGNSNSGSNSSPSSSGNNDPSKSERDSLKRKNFNNQSEKLNDMGTEMSRHKPLDWREFRASLCIQEQAAIADSVYKQEGKIPGPKSLPLKWAHPISAPENGCLLVASEKLDGVRTFERTVVLLLKSGTRNPQEGPFGVVISRPLHKKMKHMNPTNTELATTFADCTLHFGGPLEASMFLLRDGAGAGLPGFEEVIPGVCFGSRNSLDKACDMVKRGAVGPNDFRFFIGYAGWQLDQLGEEIESGYWHVAACSANLIFEGLCSSSSSSDNLWEEILQLMGGQYSELSRKPKLDL